MIDRRSTHRPPRRARSSRRGPCPGGGTPTPRTTPSSWPPSSGRQWVGAGCADDVAAPGSYLATRVGGVPVLVVRDDDGELRGLPQRLPPPRLAAGRGLRPGPRPVVPVPRLGLPPRRLAGPGRRCRRAGRFRRRRLRAAPGAGDDVRPLDARQPRCRTPRRSTPARWPPASTPYRLDELELGERSRYERRLQLEGPARELLRELPHAVHPLAAADRRLRVPDRVSPDRPSSPGTGPLAPRGRSQQALHDHRPGEPGLGGRRRRRRRTIRSTTAPTSPCSPTRRSRASPGSPPRSASSPTGPATTLVEREYFWHPSVPPERRGGRRRRHPGVVEQDLRMCETHAAHLRRRAVRRRRAVDRARGRRRPRPPAPARPRWATPSGHAACTWRPAPAPASRGRGASRSSRPPTGSRWPAGCTTCG